jgi:hypothetical protein
VFAEGWYTDRVLDDLRSRAREKLAALYSHEQWVWKDPRLCLTLPFWFDLLPPAPVFVLLHRNPLEVARSLLARNTELEFTVPYALALWERYMRAALAAAEGQPVFISSYVALLDDPVSLCARVRLFLERRGFRLPDQTPFEEIRAFLAPSLRHQVADANGSEESSDLTTPQRLLQHVMESIDGEHPRFSVPALPVETATTELLMKERRLILNLARKRAP